MKESVSKERTKRMGGIRPDGTRKKMLALMGSPRKNGNIARMLSLAVESAEAAGYETETVNLYETEISPCTGCMVCRHGVCPIADGMAAIIDKIKACDVLTLAAPTYWANVPGAVKNALDRLAGAVMDDDWLIPKPKLKGSQRYFLITACTTPAPFSRLAGQSGGALRAMREVFKTAGMRSMGCAVYAGTRGKKELPRRLVKKIKGRF